MILSAIVSAGYSVMKAGQYFGQRDKVLGELADKVEGIDGRLRAERDKLIEKLEKLQEISHDMLQSFALSEQRRTEQIERINQRLGKVETIIESHLVPRPIPRGEA